MDSELAAAYGRTSVAGSVEYRARVGGNAGMGNRGVQLRFPVVVSVRGDGTRFLSRASAYPAYELAVTARISFPQLYGLGLLVRCFRGADYYNIGFGNQPASACAAGLQVDHTTPITLTPEARRRLTTTYR